MVHSYSEIVLGVKIPLKKVVELKFQNEDEKKDALDIIKRCEEQTNDDCRPGDNLWNLYHDDLWLESPHDDLKLKFFPIQHDDTIAMGDSKDDKDNMILGYSMIKVGHRGYYEKDTIDSVSLSELLQNSEKLKTALKKYDLENEEIRLFHSSNDCGCCS